MLKQTLNVPSWCTTTEEVLSANGAPVEDVTVALPRLAPVCSYKEAILAGANLIYSASPSTTQTTYSSTYSSYSSYGSDMFPQPDEGGKGVRPKDVEDFQIY